jgi:hypothetical protein
MLGQEPGGELLAAPSRSVVNIVTADKAGIEGVGVPVFCPVAVLTCEYCKVERRTPGRGFPAPFQE